jgi:hydrogenase expression/formation protein HypD
VVAGFEPLDLLQGVILLVEQICAGVSRVENQYRRVVPDAGNPLARQAMAEVFAISGDSEWRGLGTIAESGVQLTERLTSRLMPSAAFSRAGVRCATPPKRAAAMC